VLVFHYIFYPTTLVTWQTYLTSWSLTAYDRTEPPWLVVSNLLSHLLLNFITLLKPISALSNSLPTKHCSTILWIFNVLWTQKLPRNVSYCIRFHFFTMDFFNSLNRWLDLLFCSFLISYMRNYLISNPILNSTYLIEGRYGQLDV
jgi:hypothetical protein